MKYLKLLFITIICLGLLAIGANLYAATREVVIAEQSSAQRAEGAEEARQSYEARLAEYDQLLPADKAALGEQRAAALERVVATPGHSSLASVISGPGASSLPPAGVGNAAPAVSGMPVGPRDGMPATPAAITPKAPVIQPPAPPVNPPPQIVPMRGDPGYGGFHAVQRIPYDDNVSQPAGLDEM
jgi:hypothetical protein